MLLHSLQAVSSPHAADLGYALTPEVQQLMQQATASTNYRQGRFKITELCLPRQPGGSGSLAAAPCGVPASGTVPSTRTTSDAGSMSLSRCSSMEPARYAAAGTGCAAGAGAAAGLAALHACSSVAGSAASAGTAAGAAAAAAAGLGAGAGGIVRSKSTTTMFRKGRFFVSRTTTQQMVDDLGEDMESEGEHEAPDAPHAHAPDTARAPGALAGADAGGTDVAGAIAGQFARVASSPSCLTGAAALDQDPAHKQGTRLCVQAPGLPPLPPGASPRLCGQTSLTARKALAASQTPMLDHPQSDAQDAQPGPAGLQPPAPHQAQGQPQQQEVVQERHYHAGRFNVHEVQQAPVRAPEVGGSCLEPASPAPAASGCEGAMDLDAEPMLLHQRGLTGAPALAVGAQQLAAGTFSRESAPDPPAACPPARPHVTMPAEAGQAAGDGVSGCAMSSAPVGPMPLSSHPLPIAAAAAAPVAASAAAAPLKSPGVRVGRFLILEMPDVPGHEHGPLAAASETSTPCTMATSTETSPIGAGLLRNTASEGGAAPTSGAGASMAAASGALKHMTSKGRFKVWES